MEWLGPVLTSLGATVAALFSWLSAHDRMKFDADSVQLKADIAGLQEREQNCQQQLAEAKAARIILHERVQKLESEAERSSLEMKEQKVLTDEIRGKVATELSRREDGSPKGKKR